MASEYYMDVDAVLDFTFDWTAWLDGETISSFDVTPETGLNVNSDGLDVDSEQVTAWVRADEATAGKDYLLSCKITDTAGRTDERTMTIKVRER